MFIDLSTALILVFWFSGFFFFWKIPLPDKHDYSKKVQLPEISVIIPARNESENIGSLLTSLKDQHVQLNEIIIVDDHSEENTKDVARESGVLVLLSRTLPEGWSGKPWACWQGAKASTGEAFMFLDADTYVENQAIESIIRAYKRIGGLVSVQNSS